MTRDRDNNPNTDASHAGLGEGLRTWLQMSGQKAGGESEKSKQRTEPEGQGDKCLPMSHPLGLPEITQVGSLAGDPGQ